MRERKARKKPKRNLRKKIYYGHNKIFSPLSTFRGDISKILVVIAEMIMRYHDFKVISIAFVSFSPTNERMSV